MTSYFCPNCVYVSNYKANSTRHCREVCKCEPITSIIRQKCDDCGKTYENITSFKIHLKKCPGTVSIEDQLKSIIQKQEIRIQKQKIVINRLRYKLFNLSEKGLVKQQLKLKNSRIRTIYKRVMVELLKRTQKQKLRSSNDIWFCPIF